MTFARPRFGDGVGFFLGVAARAGDLERLLDLDLDLRRRGVASWTGFRFSLLTVSSIPSLLYFIVDSLRVPSVERISARRQRWVLW